MRGVHPYNEVLFSTVRLPDFVLPTHPLQRVPNWLNDAIARIYEKCAALYEADINGGRLSIAPEKLMRAMPLQVLYAACLMRQDY